MYLAALNEEQKKLFLGLAYHIAMADGVYCDDEKHMMASYCKEMQIDLDEAITDKPASDIIEEMADICAEREKKIIVFEAVGLALVDGYYDISEQNLINMAAKKFGTTDEYTSKCEKIIKSYLQLQSQINSLVIG